jgi:Cytochrome P460
MRSFIPLLSIVIFAGCGPTPTGTLPEDPTPSDELAINFADWPVVTQKPFRVEPAVTELCRAPTPDRLLAMKEEGEKQHGPHYQPAIVVRVSPTALDAFINRQPMPLRAMVVKEKHPDAQASGPLTSYAAMIKREAGYDPENGDWEYLYEVPGPNRWATRGPLPACSDCHRQAKATDYLFRSYLKPAGPK